MVERLAEIVDGPGRPAFDAARKRKGLVSRRGPGIRLRVGLFQVVVSGCGSGCSRLQCQAVDLDDGSIVHQNAPRGGGAILPSSTRMSAPLR
jgi:hypothetical protein